MSNMDLIGKASDLLSTIVNSIKDNVAVEEGYIQLSMGRLYKDTEAYRKIKGSLANLTRRELSSITDKDIILYVGMLLGTKRTSKTVSASEAGFPEQYKKVEYFETSTVNFESALAILDTILLTEDNAETDIGTLIIETMALMKDYMNAVVNKEECNLRENIAARMKQDGLVSKYKGRTL